MTHLVLCRIGMMRMERLTLAHGLGSSAQMEKWWSCKYSLYFFIPISFTERKISLRLIKIVSLLELGSQVST